jgi:hypothetical protein
MAAERGIDMPSRSKKDDLIAALEADDQAQASEADGSGEALPEAEESSAGAITLGDMPDSATVKG